MAYTATAKSLPIRQIATAPFAFIGHILNQLNEARIMSRQVDHLTSLTDAQLDDLGMKREEIVRFVFEGRNF